MRYHDQIQTLSTDGAYYGANFADQEGLTYLAGMAVQEAAEPVEGVEARQIPAALYAVFECTVDGIGPTYGYVWFQWPPAGPYDQDKAGLGYDYYPPGTTVGDSPVEVWAPVRQKT
jgi:predicted transcriptional regulator YdeE